MEKPRPEKAESQEILPTELVEKLRQVLGEDHISYLLDSIKEGDDLQDMIGYAYGALLEQGEDPDEVLAELDIIQPED